MHANARLSYFKNEKVEFQQFIPKQLETSETV